ncbi:class I SAM-dependent methyltransferase [Litoribacter populi]|uniref:class I SAM-dependent methyltransferase n=1 Tax=Litoribacter populi TaxID=2598460 RepID=UPI00117F1FD5|nr:class I SAM-dependent methyltransferase [Litoribacter populi]
MHFSENKIEQIQKFVQDHLSDSPAQLLLKYQNKVDFDLKFAVQQISARQKAKKKLPSWAENPNLFFPVTLSMEQSSSEITAAYKGQYVSGKSLADLTGGFGVDTFFLSEKLDSATYIERDEKLCQLAENNFQKLSGGKIKVHHRDSLDFLRENESIFDWIYVDPARRGEHNQKLYKLSDCEPDIVAHWDLLKKSGKNILIKASPMLDIKAVLSELPDVQEVHVVSVKNEVKEVLLFSREENHDGVETKVKCVNLQTEEPDFTFNYSEEAFLEINFGEVGKYLYEPSASILKAGGFKSFADKYKLAKIHPNSHLYTSSSPSEIKLPARVFQVIKELKPDKKVFKQLFPKGKVNVITRNHPQKAEDIKKKFKLQDGGDDYLIGTTTADGKPRLFHCERRQGLP